MIPAEATQELAAELEKPLVGISALGHGIHRNVPEALYHRKELGVVSASALAKFAKSPATYAHWVNADDDADEEPSDALALGKAFHCAALEPERYAQQYVVAPSFGDCRKRENKLARDAWRKVNKGRTPIDLETARQIDRMVLALREQPVAGTLLEEGDAEVTIRWRDAETGLECKARADFYREELAAIADLKTTEDATAWGFRRSVANYLYHRQASFYLEGFAAVGAPADSFVFLAVEKTAPHLVGLYSLNDKALAKAYLKTRQLMRQLADCLGADSWPGLPDGIQTIDLPPWAN